ncbi:hypothetical protein KL938_004270 [Ogataea parapolymorpha]|nr:hypothetical protein KL938_004270 [Ogataea parapolymorpha]
MSAHSTVSLGITPLEGSQSQSAVQRVLSRASGVIEAIRDENEITRAETARAESLYDGQYNVADLEDTPPDGTFWGWVAAACVCSINTFSWGVNSAFGVYLNYYLEADVFPGATKRQFATVGGLSLGISFMFCQFGNVLAKRYPLKLVMGAGCAVVFLSFWLASIAKNVVQLMMFQGLLMAVGFVLVAGPSVVILPSWFLHKRSVAAGIGYSGAGLSGLIFSRSSSAIITRTGSLVWALRMVGLVCGAMLAVSIALVRPRRPFNSKNTSVWRETRRLFDWHVIKALPVQYVCAWSFVYNFAYTIMLFSYSSFCTSIGLSSDQGAIVMTVLNVAQLVGRPLLGYVSDALGRCNTTIICSLLLALLTGVFWVFVTTYAEMIVFAFLSGLLLGVNWVNFTPLTADIVGSGEDLMPAISYVSMVSGLPYVVAEVVALEMVNDSRANPYFWCQIFVVITCAVSGLLLLPYREWKIKRMLAARAKTTEHSDARATRYTLLLGGGGYAFWLRMLYPVKA